MGGVGAPPARNASGPPRPLRAEDDVSAFRCGSPALDAWLKERARRNEERRASRTYVLVGDGAVIAYYGLAAGSILHSEVRGALARQMPDPLPVIVLGRLAVDERHARSGLGSALLRDAMLRAVEAGAVVGAVLLLVHAKDEAAAAFYRRFDFEPSPLNPLTLMLRIADIVAASA